MVALLIGAAAVSALLLWHLQRRPNAPRAVSFARFLPDLPAAQVRKSRFSVIPPFRSMPFWLRMIAAGLAMLALWIEFDRPGPSEQRIGLRVVIDVSASMGLADGTSTRLAAAKEAALAAEIIAKEAAGTMPYCSEGVLVAGAPDRPQPLEAALARMTVLPQGAQVSGLFNAALAPEVDCLVTHVLVLTDALRPAFDWPADGPVLFWRQFGTPLPNHGISDISARGPGLAGGAGVVEVELTGWGDVTEPTLELIGPSTRLPVHLTRATDRENRWIGTAPLDGAGAYRVMVQPSGAFSADSSAEFHLPELPGPVLDWRLLSVPAPRGIAAGKDGVLVAAADEVSPQDLDRPVLLTYDGWSRGGTSRKIGTFTEDINVLSGLNLDVFERAAPLPFAGQLFTGFVPVLTDAKSGRVFVARRAQPPGILVPEPLPFAGGDVSALSLTLFFNSLAALAGEPRLRPEPVWRDANGAVVADAPLESNTARTLEGSPILDFAPTARPGTAEPWWPVLLLLALSSLLFERLWMLVRHFPRRRNAV